MSDIVLNNKDKNNDNTVADNKNTVADNDNKSVDNDNKSSEEQNSEKDEVKEEKKFTQKDVDSIISERLKKLKNEKQLLSMQLEESNSKIESNSTELLTLEEKYNNLNDTFEKQKKEHIVTKVSRDYNIPEKVLSKFSFNTEEEVVDLAKDIKETIGSTAEDESKSKENNKITFGTVNKKEPKGKKENPLGKLLI